MKKVNGIIYLRLFLDSAFICSVTSEAYLLSVWVNPKKKALLTLDKRHGHNFLLLTGG
jgi:hypothetical protein